METVVKNIKSKLFNRDFQINCAVYNYKNQTGAIEKTETVVLHNSLKSLMLSLMQAYAKTSPIKLSYTAIETSTGHSVVDCTIQMGGYEITETGEATISTLNTKISKSYPYLEAQKRAFDRATISFLQLQENGLRVYSDHEIIP